MQIFKKLFSWCWPRQCILCRAPSNTSYDLCAPCRSALPWIQARCQRCGMALPLTQSCCGTCLHTPPAFDRVFALFHYQSPVDQLIIALKFHEQLRYASVLGQLLADTLPAHLPYFPDIILPMPLHFKRLKERGYNQAIELARPLAKQLGIPLSLTQCVRQKITIPQSSLSFTARKQNMKNAFLIKKSLTAKSVLIVDDVMTSGETGQALSLTLRKNGVENIMIACIARAGK